MVKINLFPVWVNLSPAVKSAEMSVRVLFVFS